MVSITAISLTEFRTSGISALELVTLLPENSREKLERISNPDSYARSLLGEVLARYSLSKVSGIGNSDIHFNIAEKGKPHLQDFPDIHFNITHSGQMVACAVAGSDIGIDIEHFRKVNFQLAERFFSPSEITDLLGLDLTARQEYFFTLWTIKESFLKAIGSGLTRNLNSFTVIKTLDGFVLTGDDLSESFSIRTFLLHEKYYLAVCSKESFIPGNVQMVSLREILEMLVDSE
jgi:4'-phosphopantetheinyl transferase